MRQHPVPLRNQFFTKHAVASSIFNNNKTLVYSLALNAVFVLGFLLANWRGSETTLALRGEPRVWHGGHPASNQTGSCWCSGRDSYCMCTPSLAIDLIIVSKPSSFWLVRRRDTNQLATMGGFVQVGETVERAVVRELNEETGIQLPDTAPVLFGVYGDPRRDNRRHTVSAVYVVHLDGSEQPKAADDVKEVIRVSFDDVKNHDFFADHKTILQDFLSEKQRIMLGGSSAKQIKEDEQIVKRSMCTVEKLFV